MKKNLLWPTEIYSFQSTFIDNDKIKDIILKKEKTESTRSISNMGGWQSEESLLEQEDFSELKDFLLECTLSIKKEIYRDDVKFHLLSSWANVNRYNNYNVGHTHGNSHWSCTYYVTETYTAPLYFIDPRIRASMCTAYDLHNENNKYYNNIGLEKNWPGDVLFFPSWLEHAVSKNSTNNPRISIACNFLVAS